MTACTLVHGLGLASLIFFLTPYSEILEKTRRTTRQTPAIRIVFEWRSLSRETVVPGDYSGLKLRLAIISPSLSCYFKVAWQITYRRKWLW